MRRFLQNMSFIIHIALLVYINFAGSNSEYCSLTCNGKKHTMCMYEEGGGPQCEGFRRGLTKDEQVFLVNIHNELRESAAVGKEQAEAANMMKMVWSDEGEKIAQRWADQCTKGTREDDCRSLKNNEHGGQIVGVVGKSGVEDTYNIIRNTVLNWYKSNKTHFNGKSLHSYNFDPKTFAYTQIIWARTEELGCGYSWGMLGGALIHRLVCNYYPAGNVRGEPVYIEGRTCSECPYVQCSKDWRGLCAHKTHSVWNQDRGERRVAGHAHYTLILGVVSLIMLLAQLRL